MSPRIEFEAEVPDELAGWRLDQALARMFPDYSRARLQQWIRQGEVTIDGRVLRPRDRLVGAERVVVRATLEEPETPRPQPIPLQIVYEDEALLVIDKPPGMVVHPAAGNPQGTLQNALLHYAPELGSIPRAGIVHRLDKDTSGLLVVARSLAAHHHLVAELQARALRREYDAVVLGVMTAGGTVEAPIGRHPVDRKRMAVRDGGKPAVTHYRVAERFRAHTHVRVTLETGRTHQIRVHMAHLGYPLVGDRVYGGRLRLPPRSGPRLAEVLRGFRRQALHAARLGLVHPVSGEPMDWQVPLPEDIRGLIEALRQDREAQG
ncbi:MAG: 23S rRNA pseudouridine(1911/1915/1917) synthase RluD [Gammaproteobacteria bacterium]|nr:23S rRNA pseudouridine(1911/1915/1917) synthase RluD [Gammaproteobacteria bacterium]NIR97795.1 23S rRNA pseudouridine(1911/1915/1917) synthase RluD [Gammaproteobacteria bacterium]NIT63495.1 23S rRNA pseudouridine(1911/1915/1917) synthase RluD [Gammaproteobacteria bacterium]NIV20442.1 23S rRNA pseudouridine(1911/1915/1917) synthase RluD [Gammaproteobacteria bacterium]NIX11024.1 23S rRNA pseudouridine(1911/1915/1917) synthase RluD [Gammaproteobacteria bacterium]